MKGGLTNEHPFTRGDEQSTYFQQMDKGLSRDFNAFIDALLASKDVVVATKSGTIPMPKIDVKDAKKVRHQQTGYCYDMITKSLPVRVSG